MTESKTPDSFLHPAIQQHLAALKPGEPHVLNGFGLWPLFAEARPEPAYLTLVDALALAGFKITEVSEGGSVPTLRVVNETIVHLALFGGTGAPGHPAEPRLLRRRGYRAE